MGLFGIGKKRSDPWNQDFANCDFEFAKNELISTFSGGVYPKEMTVLFDAYIANPCKQTAIKLIRYDKDFTAVFYDNKKRLEMMTRSGIDVSKPRKNVKLLMREPDFEEFCNSIVEDVEKHKTMKEKYLGVGYTQSMIDEAFSKYWQGLAGDLS